MPRGNVIKFEGVQEHCVQAGKIKFGAKAKWSDCSVTRGRWVVTLDFIDMYQAQYCLGKGAGECDQRAFTAVRQPGLYAEGEGDAAADRSGRGPNTTIRWWCRRNTATS